jgi:GMP synthase-like glutamine amidotransferase
VRSKPVFGTCAGAILLAREVRNPAQRSMGILDAVVERNAYGRQIDSAILTAETKLPGGPLEMVFIRAPRIVETGAGVEVLALREGYAALVRQGRVLAATFHPELSSDRRVHRLFVEMVAGGAQNSRLRMGLRFHTLSPKNAKGRGDLRARSFSGRTIRKRISFLIEMIPAHAIMGAFRQS